MCAFQTTTIEGALRGSKILYPYIFDVIYFPFLDQVHLKSPIALQDLSPVPSRHQ